MQSAIPAGLFIVCNSFPALPCRAFTFRRFATGLLLCLAAYSPLLIPNHAFALGRIEQAWIALPHCSMDLLSSMQVFALR